MREVAMELAGLLQLFQSWGPSAISSALVFVVLYLIKKVDTNSKKIETNAMEAASRAEVLRDDINKTLNSFGERLSIVEKDYVKNDFFFRELSGWKSEINRLSDQISSQFMAFTQSIIQLFK
jgi:hypothetical protein